ncbi:hypothetical protein MN608_02206 [Microdochium nivale]|nr:hypothetical protein MN608_02206 [Microdochium nivale]
MPRQQSSQLTRSLLTPDVILSRLFALPHSNFPEVVILAYRHIHGRLGQKHNTNRVRLYSCHSAMHAQGVYLTEVSAETTPLGKGPKRYSNKSCNEQHDSRLQNRPSQTLSLFVPNGSR